MTSRLSPSRVLILGGSTPAGSVLAHRSAQKFSKIGHEVFWFDCVPFGPDEPQLPLPPGVRRFRFGNQRQLRIAKRMESALPHDRPITRLVKRWNTATEGYASWRTMKAHLHSQFSDAEPNIVVFCDEFARTAAWHVARKYRSALIERAAGE